MDDDEVAALLDGQEPLVVIEAPAGCGKTYQGASFADRVSARLDRGRILILTHTHAACGVFAKATSANSSRVEIKTIDGLIAQISGAYHKTLGLPADPSIWARKRDDGYAQLAAQVAQLIEAKPMIAEALSERFPVIIGDEHQDASENQHAIMLALQRAGARLRVFGDPMQQIYRNQGQGGFDAGRERWQALKEMGAYGELECPHRWDGGSPALGAWIMRARESLKNGEPVDLTGDLPEGLRVVRALNTAQTRTGYQLSPYHRRPLDEVVDGADALLILTDQNPTATSLRAFWNRRIPIWEGYTRNDLGVLVDELTRADRTPESVCAALNSFVYGISAGYSPSSHGNRLAQEVREGCARAARGKPALLQEIARSILKSPDHRGVAAALAQIEQYRMGGEAGFVDIKIDHVRELHDAIRLGAFERPDEALAELHRRRAYARPRPPAKAISTIHKAKGLECDHAILLPCDGGRFGNTEYARCKLYVALSRARRSLTLAICPNNPGPLFNL